MIDTDYQVAYKLHVERLEKRLKSDAVFRNAIGGEFIAVGKLEYYLLRSLGLADGQLVVDVGCGSGRLASQLAPFPGVRYIGTDVVPSLLNYATELCRRPDWEFIATKGAGIPCQDAQADFVCFFSVFTHLLHEDTYKYLCESARILKPGGLVVFSFLEFKIQCHWDTFAVSMQREDYGRHLNQFIDRDGIHAWATHAGLKVRSIHDGDAPHIPIPEEIRWEGGQYMVGLGNLGQSVAVLQKP